jgi:hypothetical protein
MFSIFPIGSIFIREKDFVAAFVLSAIFLICIAGSNVASALLINPVSDNDSGKMVSADETGSADTNAALRAEWSADVENKETNLGYDEWNASRNAEWLSAVKNNDTTLGYEDWVRRRNR